MGGRGGAWRNPFLIAKSHREGPNRFVLSRHLRKRSEMAFGPGLIRLLLLSEWRVYANGPGSEKIAREAK